MKKKLPLVFLLLICIALSACTNSLGGTAAESNTNAVQSSSTASINVEFDNDDLDTGLGAEASNIALEGESITFDGSGAAVKGSTITISSAGIYSISGTLNDGQIIVDTKDDKPVKLILSGANINCSNSSAIYVVNAEKTVVTLAEGTENIISDGKSYVFPDSDTDEPNAAIFSHDDLTINGSGSLQVDGNFQHGIVSKDDLKIVSGNITVNSVTDGIKGRNLVAIKEGTITINSGADGIKSNNDEDTGKGVVVIENGTIDITAEDDGIHAESTLDIKDGNITIVKSYEGIESATINIDGGNIDITSSDDGINVAGGNDSSGMTNKVSGQVQQSDSSESYNLNINGGNIVVNADGDGLDANGAITMTGGTVLINGPTSSGNGALDYDSGFNITGGTIVAAGSSGMALAPDETSTQYSILVNLPSALEAGTMINLQSKNGEEIITFVPEKQYQSVAISSPNIKNGETYLVYSGGSSTGTEVNGLYSGGTYTKGTQLASIEVTGIVTTFGQGGMMGPGGGMGKGGGTRPDGGARMQPGGGSGMQPPDGTVPGNNPDGTVPKDNINPDAVSDTDSDK